MFVPHELRRNTFVLLKAGTKVTVLDPGPDGKPYEVTLQCDRKNLFGSAEGVFISEETAAAWAAAEKKTDGV